MGSPRKFLTAEWRYLAMLNYEMEPAALRPYVPAGTELDPWNGRTLISLVGFLFLNTRVLGVRLPMYQDFEEVNLRFYVRRKTPDGWRRGVVFIKEMVPRWFIAKVARTFYQENYIALPMQHILEINAEDNRVYVTYSWRFKERWNGLQMRAAGPPQPLTPGSQEEFITEHYWGYTAWRNGESREYQVEHPRWRVWRPTECAVDCDAAQLCGPAFVEPLKAKPCSAFLAEGSPVTVYRGTKIKANSL